MALAIHVERRPGATVVVKLTGRLDFATYQQCHDALAPVLTGVTRHLLFDMSALDYISSMGLRVILEARKAIETRGGQVSLTHLQAPIRKVFEIASVLPDENIFASVAEADRYFDAIQRQVRAGETGSQ
jgi:anti-sigma B factor antagonist